LQKEESDKACECQGKNPSRLHRGDRPVVEEFAGEALYRRYSKVPSKPASEWVMEAISTSDMSVCRSQFCETEDDVLITEKGLVLEDKGIAVVGADELATIQAKHSTTGAVHIWGVKHTPYDCLYPHSDLQVIAGDSVINGVKNGALKSMLRRELNKKFKSVRDPK
jgi:hypothetical protein